MNNKTHLKLLLKAIEGDNVQIKLEELVSNSIIALEEYFHSLSLKEKTAIVKFTLNLFEIKSTSKSFHECRFSLLEIIIRNIEIVDLFEYEIDDFDIIKHITHIVNMANLEIKLFLEAKIIEFDNKSEELINNGNEDENEFKIVSISFYIVDNLITQLNKDENLNYLESNKKISGVDIIELIECLKYTVNDCIDFILDIENDINLRFKPYLNKNFDIEKTEISENKLIETSKLYWTINYCCSISSKWQIIEPDKDLHKFIKMLEITSKYLNPLHFASTFPTMVHISIVDWANIPNILESLIVSLLSFCTLIKKEENSEELKEKNLHGLYNGLYYTSLLITAAWWSPGIDTYRIIVSKLENKDKKFEYLARCYINLDNLNNIDFNYEDKNKLNRKNDIKKNNLLNLVPIDTNTIPEYVSNDNPGVERIRRVALLIFNLLNSMDLNGINPSRVEFLKKIDFLKIFDKPESLDCEKLSAIIQTLICVLTLLTCRIKDSEIPEQLWKIIFIIIIKLTPNSSRSYYFDSSKKISIFISCLRSVAIAFSTNYSDFITLFKETIQDLNLKSTYSIPKLIIKEYCQEFSKEDEEAVNFFRRILD